MTLTPRQLDVLSFIRDFRHIHGYAPTIRELADTFHVATTTIFWDIAALEQKRMIRRAKNIARSIEITSDAALPLRQSRLRFPVVGTVGAGGAVSIPGVRLPDESRATKFPVLGEIE